MQENINIKPEYENLKNISPFWDNENETLTFGKSDYDVLQKFITDYTIDIKIDNLCYIICLLEQEKHKIDIREQLKDHRKKIQNDRLEVSEFLKKWGSNQELIINSIKFDKDTGNFIFRKDGFFTIEHPEIIEQVIKIIWKTYKYKSSLKTDFKERLKIHKRINDKHFRCETLAKSLNKYFTDNTTLNLNKRYFVIGFLFQFTGIETELSMERFNQTKEVSYKAPYKSYPDFVTTNIRSKYFKGVTKQSKKT